MENKEEVQDLHRSINRGIKLNRRWSKHLHRRNDDKVHRNPCKGINHQFTAVNSLNVFDKCFADTANKHPWLFIGEIRESKIPQRANPSKAHNPDLPKHRSMAYNQAATLIEYRL